MRRSFAETIARSLRAFFAMRDGNPLPGIHGRRLCCEALEDRQLLSAEISGSPVIALRWEDAGGEPLDGLTFGDDVQLALYADGLAEGTTVALSIYEDDWVPGYHPFLDLATPDDLIDDTLSVTIGADGVGRTPWRVVWLEDAWFDPEYYFRAPEFHVDSSSLQVADLPGGVGLGRNRFFVVAPWQAIAGEAIPLVLGYVSGSFDFTNPELDFAQVRVGQNEDKVDLYSVPSGGVNLAGNHEDSSRDFAGPGAQDYVQLGLEPWWYTLGYIRATDYEDQVDDGGNLSISVDFHVSWEDDLWLETEQTTNVSLVPGLPSWDNWYAGDTHFHSAITNSMDFDAFVGLGVLGGEYGSPLAIASMMASAAAGLEWITVTDHSFEIDGSNDWRVTGPEKDPWRDLSDTESYLEASEYYGWGELEDDPALSSFLFVKGVELSVRAPDPHVPLKLPELIPGVETAQLHMLGYGFDAGDSPIAAPSYTGPSLPPIPNPTLRGIDDIMSDVQDASHLGRRMFTYAAHPSDEDAFSAEAWEVADVHDARAYRDPQEGTPLFRGYEFWNGRRDGGRDRSLALWEEVLAEIMDPSHGTDYEHSWYLSAGSDEHLSLRLDGIGNVGDVRTVVFAPSLTDDDVLDALYRGRGFVTDGPWFAMGVDGNGDGDFMDHDVDTMMGGQAVLTDPRQGIITFGWPLDQSGAGDATPSWPDPTVSNITLYHYNSDGDRNRIGTLAEKSWDAYADWYANRAEYGSGWQAYRAELNLNGYKAYTNPLWLYFDVDPEPPTVQTTLDPARQILRCAQDDTPWSFQAKRGVILSEAKNLVGESHQVVTFTLEDSESLGPVDFWARGGLDLSRGDLWYRFQSTRDGVLTAEATVAGTAGSVSVALYDEDRNLLATSRRVDDTQRIDWEAEAGASYLVRVGGTGDGIQLRIANLVDRVGANLTVHGTDGDDRFEFAPVGPYLITINGIRYAGDAEVSLVTFDGHAGQDTAIFTGSAEPETAAFWPDHGEFRGRMVVTAENTENFQAYMGEGHDTVRFYDSPQAEALTAWAHTHRATMTGGVSYQADGFEELYVHGTAGGTEVDKARLYDTDGDDLFVGQDGWSMLSRPGDYVHRVENFEQVRAYAIKGGHDTAELHDSPRDDWMRAMLQYDYAYIKYDYNNRDDLFHKVTFFDSVSVFASDGDRDIAQLYDSRGNDHFAATPSEATLEGNGYRVSAQSFEYAIGYAKHGGTDVAQLAGSQGDDKLKVSSTYAILKGNDPAQPFFFLKAKFFDEVYTKAGAGYDTAYLNPSPLNDRLEGGGALADSGHWAKLSSGPYVYWISEFERAYARSGDKEDAASVDPNTADWLFVRGWNEY